MRQALDSERICEECGAVMKLIDPREGKESWICPVALEEKEKGWLGPGSVFEKFPGQKHIDCIVYGGGEIRRRGR